MSLVRKTLFYIEANLENSIELKDISKAVGYTPYHLSHVFTKIIGNSPIKHMRQRRLSEAAKKIVVGKIDFLTLALDFQFGSAEAFSRAFRREFSLSPSQLKMIGHSKQLNITEAINMENDIELEMKPTKIVTKRAMKLVGFSGIFTKENRTAIPSLWRKIVPYFGTTDGEIKDVSYGVSFDCDGEEFCYFVGFEISAHSTPPSELEIINVPEQYCAIFEHTGHISEFTNSYDSIYKSYFSKSKNQLKEGYEVEIYDTRFDGASGIGIVEICMPIIKN